jgi:hypothetical protein
VTPRPRHRRWSAFGKLGLVAGLAVLATPLTSSAASLPDPCHLLTKAQATGLLGAKPWDGNHPLANGFCVYSAPSENSSATAPPSIAVTVKTGPNVVRGFGVPGNPGAPRRAFGLPPGVTAKDIQPHPLRVDGVLAYYVGPIPGTASVTFHALLDGVVIVTDAKDVPGTPVSVGKRVMTEVLGNLKVIANGPG